MGHFGFASKLNRKSSDETSIKVQVRASLCLYPLGAAYTGPKTSPAAITAAASKSPKLPSHPPESRAEAKIVPRKREAAKTGRRGVNPSKCIFNWSNLPHKPRCWTTTQATTYNSFSWWGGGLCGDAGPLATRGRVSGRRGDTERPLTRPKTAGTRP